MQFQPSSAKSQPKQQSSKSDNKSKTWRVSDQQTELEKAGLDSSIFYPPEFHNKIFEALGLDTEKYKHVNPDNLAKFKDIIRKYSAAFLLPGVNLEVIKGAEHQILTGDVNPSYTLPYRKSPS